MGRTIKYIFVHCTAGNQRATAEDLRAEFRRQGRIHPGYHYAVLADGRITQLLDEALPANGVRGYNACSIHVAYTGGIDADGQPADNRTPAQREKLRELLRLLRKRYPEARILGHRDISPDRNGNGRVDPWERIKECPCFDAITEYKDI